MPYIKTHASTPIPKASQEALKTAYGMAISAVPGKSEAWLMCVFDGDASIYFKGSDAEPCAFVEVGVFARGEVPASAWESLTEQITPAVSSELGIDPARIYINYASTPNFGWNGANF